jgi:LacI family transcriptional regulator
MVAQQQRLEGVIISPVNFFDTLTRFVLEDFERGGVPVVLLDRDLMGGSLSSVTADDLIGAYNAVIRLLDEGHERIAIIRGSPSNRPVYERTFGYL